MYISNHANAKNRVMMELIGVVELSRALFTQVPIHPK